MPINFKVSVPPLIPIVTSGLVLYLDAGNASSYPGSGTTWTDLSVSGNNATLFNSPTFSSSNGGYFIFNGSNQYGDLSIPSLLPTGNEVTFCAWTYGVILKQSNLFWANQSNGGRTINIHEPWVDGNVYWDCGGTSEANFDRIFVNQNPAYLGWHYWVFTKNASTGIMAMYKDNSVIQTGTSKTLTIPTSVAANIGRQATTGGVNYYQGYIAQIQIYNRVLNNTELTQNYNVDKATYGL